MILNLDNLLQEQLDDIKFQPLGKVEPNLPQPLDKVHPNLPQPLGNPLFKKVDFYKSGYI